MAERQWPSGIRRTATSWQVFARVHGEFRSRRFPLETDLNDLKRERDKLKTSAYYGVAIDADAGEGFAKDAAAYLALVKGMPSYEDRAYEIRAWSKAFGSRLRSSITGRDIRTVLERWRLGGKVAGGGLSPSSLNRRRTALMSLFTTLDGKSAANPVKDVPPLPEHHNEIVRAHDPRLLYRLLARVGRRKWKHRKATRRRRGPLLSKTRARLRLMLWTGWPQAQVMQLQPEDVDWTAGRETARVSRRKKGRGAKARRVPLLPGAVIALRAFAKADAWGTFSTSSMHTSLTEAVAAENAWRLRWKKRPVRAVRPYDFRHTFGTEIAKRLTDERAIQELMLHSTPHQTRRYTEGATAERLELARAVLTGAKVVKTGRAVATVRKRARKAATG